MTHFGIELTGSEINLHSNRDFRVYLGVKTCQFFLCLGVIVCVLYLVSGLFVVLLVLCFMSLVSFTGFYTEDEPDFITENHD